MEREEEENSSREYFDFNNSELLMFLYGYAEDTEKEEQKDEQGSGIQVNDFLSPCIAKHDKDSILPPKNLIAEFIMALDEEIKAIKAGNDGRVIKIFNGHFLGVTSGLYMYAFNLESFLVTIDDTPAEIEVNGKTYKCQIVSVQGQEVRIAIEQNLGELILEAKVQTNLWFLLELLRKKFEKSALEGDEKFRISEQLFAGYTSVIHGKEENPQYAIFPEKPNPSQMDAIKASFNKTLAVIWGPPGTGKTRTIAKAIEAHLNSGRRVLLVSHANIAVDEALEKVAHQCTTFYNDGKLVRLGAPHKLTLKREYPLVIADQIVTKFGATLATEKVKLKSELALIEQFFEYYEKFNKLKSILENAVIEHNNFKEELAEISVSLKTANGVVEVYEEQQKHHQQKLEEAKRSGFIKRLFFGLNPNTIIHKIDQTGVIIDSKKRIVVDFELRYDETKLNIIKKDGELVQLKKLVQEFSHQYSQYQLSQYGIAKDSADKRRIDINSRIAEIDTSLDEIQTRVLSEARLVATTLTKTFTAKQFPDNPFDVLIVDESSMAPLPLLYWAASKVSLAITIIGDFNQLPPICVSEVPIAQKWLGHSIFDVLNINTVQKARKDGRVSLLDIQYRMNPSIANISNQLFYEGILKNDPSTENHLLKDSLSGKAPLILIDTAQLNPWCSRLSTGGRFNISSALISASITRKLSTDINHPKIGIVTPYRAHAQLIGKIVKDWGISDRVRINTVHSFQGGEEEVMIFDCVEGPGVSTWSMLDDMRAESDALLLLNVALTRAKCKLFLIVQTEHLLSIFKKDSAILKIIELFKKSGCKISAETVVDNYLGVDFERVVNATPSQKGFLNGAESGFYTHKNFWQAFKDDVRNTQHSIILMSPFISLNRAGGMMDSFRVLIEKKVKIWIYTRPPWQQSANLSEHAEQVIKQFEKLGAKVIQREGMHQKIAIIDEKILWMGSLNILSHKDTQEQMSRFEGQNAIKEIIRNMELKEVEIDKVDNSKPKQCPECLKKRIQNQMVLRKGKFGIFLGCSSFPVCRHTENV